METGQKHQDNICNVTGLFVAILIVLGCILTFSLLLYSNDQRQDDEIMRLIQMVQTVNDLRLQLEQLKLRLDDVDQRSVKTLISKNLNHFGKGELIVSQ